MKNLVFDSILCRGCRSCMMACSFAHEGAFSLTRSRIRVTMDHHDDCFLAVCVECAAMPCADACPCAAIARDEQGVTRIDQELCVACGACVDACPQNGLRLAPDGERVLKCDSCNGDPACVKVCIPKAIRVEGA